MSGVWSWLDAHPGSAEFLGLSAGALLGLVAILLGALYNARLERKRDDRNRNSEARTLASALLSELKVYSTALKFNASKATADEKSDFLVRDLNSGVRVYPAVADKMGLLGASAVRKVIAAYGLLEQYTETLLVLGATKQTEYSTHRVVLRVPNKDIGHFSEITRNCARVIDEAVWELEALTTYPDGGSASCVGGELPMTESNKVINVVFSDGVKLRAEMDNQNAKAVLLLNGGGATALSAILPSVVSSEVAQLALPMVLSAFVMSLGLLATIMHNLKRRECSLVYENYWRKNEQPNPEPKVCVQSKRLLKLSMWLFFIAVLVLTVGAVIVFIIEKVPVETLRQFLLLDSGANVPEPLRDGLPEQVRQ